jgi:Bacterial dnaA protein helix-turn-helix
LLAALKSKMNPAGTLLSARSPPDQLPQFAWIVHEAIKGTNEARGHIYQVSIRSLFRSPVLPLARSSRLLAVALAHDLLGWNSRLIGAAFGAAPKASTLLRQSRQWLGAGCLDDVSGRSLASVREAVLTAFSAMAFPETQNLTANKPPDPPPRRPSTRTRRTAEEVLHPKPRDALSAAHILATVANHFGVTQQAILSNARHRELVTPRHVGMYLMKTVTRAGYPTIARQFHRKDHTTALHAVRKITEQSVNSNEFRKLLDELAGQARALGRAADGKEAVNLMPIASASPATGRVPLPVPSSSLTLDDPLVKAPFLRHLHERLIKAALAMELSVKEFIAEMIAAGIRRKYMLRPLAPPPFLQVLSHNGLDVPERLAPHAMFIQQTLYEFAALLPTRASLQARAAVIRQIGSAGTTAGD